MNVPDVAVINRFLELAAPNISTHEALEFTDKPLSIIKPPKKDSLELATLTGLADAITAQVEGLTDITVGDYMLHVDSPTSVRFVARATDKFGNRREVAVAEYPKAITPFRFGAWHDPENFIIGVQAGFQPFFVDGAGGQGSATDLDYVLKVASNISAEASTVNQDDGISQNVTMKSGIVLKDNATLKSRVKLAPYRTFTEIAQVVSEFVFRTKTDGERILLALFEADGGRWQIDAATAIADWLKKNTSGIPVVR